jgi:hypothetical protein
MGYWPLGLAEAAKTLGLTALLFAAPLYERLLIDGCWEDWLTLKPLAMVWADWPAWRNFVAVGTLHRLSSVHVPRSWTSAQVSLWGHPLALSFFLPFSL